jgi:hypothetical protein
MFIAQVETRVLGPGSCRHPAVTKVAPEASGHVDPVKLNIWLGAVRLVVTDRTCCGKRMLNLVNADQRAVFQSVRTPMTAPSGRLDRVSSDISARPKHVGVSCCHSKT